MTTFLERALGLVPPSNPELVGLPLVVLRLAHDTATAPGDAHVVDVLLKIGSVADALEETGVDVARARRGVEAIIAALPRRAGVGARFFSVFRTASDRFDRLHAPRAHALSAGLSELTAPFALASLVAEPSAVAILRALEDAGFSLRRYRWYVAHRRAADAPCPEAGPVRVVFHDDPFTPMEFVVEVLVGALGRDPATADALMHRVHEEGSAALATMDAAVAARGIAEVRARAEAAGWPLRVSAVAAG